MAAPEVKKVRVRAVTMIWNGSRRIREGTVFDYPLAAGAKLPKCVELVEEKEAEEVTLGKRARDDKPTNLVKDAPAPRGLPPIK